ncbi:hypothetical protein [Scleromatobacter humisilvae]|uniref:Uncharacterized protein n=1 Tax=Scleromatobacter humisilvae TaxID=2897159 RepID=A0A9X1YJX8_9BURK|nr:hypothetical protein [Scleromatobacter humisilvae]MCK9687281.1 hypothetical protein [Scleromatobacter humisilvae]
MKETGAHTAEMNLEVASRLLDAASCITIVRQVRTTARGYAYRLSLFVRRSDETELHDLAKAIGVEGHVAPISTRGVTYFQLSWHGASVVSVLEVAKPWLRERAKEARLAAKFWRDGAFDQHTRGPVAEEVWAKRDALYAAMRALKVELAGRERVVSAHRDLSAI